MELPARFEQLVRSRCRLAEPDLPLDPSRTLVQLGVDSLEVVDLIVDIEDTYHLQMPEELLTPEVFTSPATIWQALRGLVPSEDGDRTDVRA